MPQQADSAPVEASFFDCIEPLAARWYVLRTKPRQETRAQENLKAWGLETLLPVLPERRKNPRAQRVDVRALFPSYIFCRFTDDLFAKVKFTYGVAYVVSFGGVAAAVDQSIIDGIREHTDEQGRVRLLDDLRDWNKPAGEVREELQAGDQVVIQSGPFTNMVGVLQKNIHGNERVRILLDVLGRSTVECRRGDVKKVAQ